MFFIKGVMGNFLSFFIYKIFRENIQTSEFIDTTTKIHKIQNIY
jgi:hypothetical protein